jgi:hypothetical protein
MWDRLTSRQCPPKWKYNMLLWIRGCNIAFVLRITVQYYDEIRLGIGEKGVVGPVVENNREKDRKICKTLDDVLGIAAVMVYKM